MLAGTERLEGRRGADGGGPAGGPSPQKGGGGVVASTQGRPRAPQATGAYPPHLPLFERPPDLAPDMQIRAQPPPPVHRHPHFYSSGTNGAWAMRVSCRCSGGARGLRPGEGGGASPKPPPPPLPTPKGPSRENAKFTVGKIWWSPPSPTPKTPWSRALSAWACVLSWTARVPGLDGAGSQNPCPHEGVGLPSAVRHLDAAASESAGPATGGP